MHQLTRDFGRSVGSHVDLAKARTTFIKGSRRLEERRELVMEAIRNLPPETRACVAFRLYQNRSYREIAEFLGVSVDTVRRTLENAKHTLRKAIGHRVEIEDVDFLDCTN
jgi:DNA-directed RNA polymerase specialized sigma24 family protein